MNAFKIPLTKGIKIYPEVSKEHSKSFKQMWEETQSNPFEPINVSILSPNESISMQEKYSWVDQRLEEMYSHVEEDDDQEKNNSTFPSELEESYVWVDDRLEEMSSRVEEDDDEAKNKATFASE